MRNRFQIGNAEFEFAPETSVAFAEGGMRFNLQARPVRFDKSLHRPAFDPEAVDNPESGRIAPAFFTYSLFHFYDNHDTPLRHIRHPQQQPTTHDFYLSTSGLSYGLRFFGDIDLRPERIELRGILRQDYETDDQGAPVHIVYHCTPGQVELKPHTYGSLEEAMAMPPERVRRLIVRDWDGVWRDEILRFTQLEFLSLPRMQRPGNDDAALPDAFCELKHLRELFIRCFGMKHLPARFGELTALEELTIEYGVLETLPDSMAGLTRLHRMVLKGNRLRTLPGWVGELPALTVLNIEDNPFESLPASLKRIRKVHVEKKNEALFRDIRYRPEVEAAVDREQFMARSSPWHVARLSEALSRHKLKRYEKALLRHARQALRLVTTEPEDYAAKGNTRIGGAPDLPPDVDYPNTDGKLWHFYAQLDLAELAPLQSWLPRSGRLYFFGEGQEHGDGVRVLHSSAAPDTLRTYAWPEDGEFVDGSNVPEAYEGYKARVEATVSVPRLYNARQRLGPKDAALLNIEDDDALQTAYWALEEELTGNADRQRGAHLMNAHVFTQHENPEEQASRDKGGLPAEWINLLMLDSDNNPGFCFWDAGTFTYAIHEKDLALGDFSRVHWSLESS